MKERPIIFSAPMVRAILEGRKTQTRRVVKPQPFEHNPPDKAELERVLSAAWDAGFIDVRCPYGVPGDRLWVREAWAMNMPPSGYLYRADDLTDYYLRALNYSWANAMFMPRKASRILLEVVAVRVERVQEISESDAKAEGAPASKTVEMRDGSPCHSTEFQRVWHSIHGIDERTGWDANPWVWVVEFKRLEPA